MNLSFRHNFNYLLRSITTLAPYKRRLILILFDFIALITSLFISSWFVRNDFIAFVNDSSWLFISWITIGIGIYSLSGQYKPLTLYTGGKFIFDLSKRNLLLIIIIFLIKIFNNDQSLLVNHLLLLSINATILISLLRFLMKRILRENKIKRTNKSPNVVIYGAGEAGVQLYSALLFSGSHNIKAFIDDNKLIKNRNINGIPIYSPDYLEKPTTKIDEILIAIPSLSKTRRRMLLKFLNRYSYPLLQIPSISELASGNITIDTLKPISIEDLLCRDQVIPDRKLLGPTVTNSCVCITGAGGSIGSEICRQVISLKPEKLILLDNSEPSLYGIYQELVRINKYNVSLDAVLGDTRDYVLLEKLFTENSVDTLFHAAAYKHVPLVEANPLSGLSNNVVSARVICEAASKSKVKKVTLVSTDKAVRPTNVMGASKRLSELIFQSFAEKYSTSCFSMVRFGNVLDSSGSVIPLFRRQIKEGGPLTITHPEIYRYFMSIPEAAQLVIQSSALADGGEVFLLHMGDPIRIKDLAHSMIRLSGRTIKDKNNLDGDIEIVYSGLRPGEKLYEELLLEDNAESTLHPLIYKAKDSFILLDQLIPSLKKLEKSIYNQDKLLALKILQDLVPEWENNQK